MISMFFLGHLNELALAGGSLAVGFANITGYSILSGLAVGNCPQTTGCGVLRGTARPKVGANINLGCFYLIGMPVSIWLAFYGGYDFQGLWLGLLAAQASCAITMLIVLYKTDWEFEALRARKLTGENENNEIDEEKSLVYVNNEVCLSFFDDVSDEEDLDDEGCLCLV
ncbi:hypothetical protein TSUD_292510 [Trifolium subterraneum]|uniref:Protein DETOXIFICATION n=1 Tax=Trifolium subterraneum TaxID=3900 RepID=A0A2Z6P4Q3_TRISU|nr:hypothetical protein TSUD_292510 [Trifolium subterraneum]